MKENYRSEGSPYYQFHCANIGYHWIERKTGKVITKAEMWTKYKKEPKMLTALTNGYTPEYSKEPKKNYNNGRYFGV